MDTSDAAILALKSTDRSLEQRSETTLPRRCPAFLPSIHRLVVTGATLINAAFI
jgi:hypothetical protein